MIILNLKVEPGEASSDTFELFAISNKASIHSIVLLKVKNRRKTTNKKCCYTALFHLRNAQNQTKNMLVSLTVGSKVFQALGDNSCNFLRFDC